MINDGKIVTLKTFENAEMAHLLKGKLESEGISAMVAGENFSRVYPVGFSFAGVRVQIFEKDLKKAVEILDRTKKKSNIEDFGPCPNCGGLSVEKKHWGIEGIKGLLFAVLHLVFVIPAHYNRRNSYVCKTCGKNRDDI